MSAGTKTPATNQCPRTACSTACSDQRRSNAAEVPFASLGFHATRLLMQGVIDYLSRTRPGLLSELCEYVRFPSVSAQPQHRGRLKACAEWVVKHCRQIGLEARLCPTPGHPIVIAKTPRDEIQGPAPPAFRGLRAL